MMIQVLRHSRLGRSPILRVLLTATVLILGPSASHARENPGGPDERDARIADLERRVSEMEAAIAKLRDGGGAAGLAELQRRLELLSRELEKAKLGEAAAPRELKPAYGLGPAASKVYGVDRGVSIGGYGEALLQDFAARTDGGARSGRTTELDFLRAVMYFGYKFTDRVVFNSEWELEHATTGEGDEEKGEVSVEFANIDFLLHEAVNVRAGLMLMPVGIINEQHEPPTFLGARRPAVETLVIPSTWRETGVGVFGDLGPVSYRAYLVNSLDAAGFSADEGLREGRQGGSQAKARDVAFTARADFHGLPGLLAGASFFTGDSGQGADLDPNGPGRAVGGRVVLYDLHAEYNYKGLQLRGLWCGVAVGDAARISELTSETVGSRMRGWYGQAGYDVLAPLGEGTRQALIPYVRYERLDTQDRVAAGFSTDGHNDVRVITYGAAYKPISNLSIKAEFQDVTRGDGSGTDQVNAALGYLF